MNSAADLGALGPGALSIVAEIADERVCSVRVVSSRPPHLTRLFIGRSADEIPILAERIYSLCGLSHANMRMIVRAVPQDEYDKWVANQLKPAKEPAAGSDAAAAAGGQHIRGIPSHRGILHVGRQILQRRPRRRRWGCCGRGG